MMSDFIVSDELFTKVMEITDDFRKTDLNDLYHNLEVKDLAEKIKEKLKELNFRFEDLSQDQRAKLGFGSWTEESEIYGLIPLWVFRLLDPQTKLICPLTEYVEGPKYAKYCGDDTRFGCVAYEFYRGEEEPKDAIEENVTEDLNSTEDDSEEYKLEQSVHMPKVVEIEKLLRKSNSDKDVLNHSINLINSLLWISSLKLEEPIRAEMECSILPREIVMELVKLYEDEGYNIYIELINKESTLAQRQSLGKSKSSKLMFSVSIPG